MTSFWIAAAVLVALGAAFLFYPVWRTRKRSGHWSPVGIGIALAMPALALAVYGAVSSWDFAAEEQSASNLELLERLEQALEERPEDIEGWGLLGRSYMQLGYYDRAQAAFREAYLRTPEPANDLKLALAEAMALTDRNALAAEAGALVEEVLASEPGNPKALWYGGIAAIDAGRSDTARERWSRLLELGPPPELAAVLEQQLAMLGDLENAPFVSTAPSPAEQGGEGAVAPESVIRMRVSLGEGRSLADLGPDAALFVFASTPAGGPPIAVLRPPPNALPAELTLSDANRMLGAAAPSLADFEEVTLVARLTPSGQALEQPGDWFARATAKPGSGDVVELIIDQVVQ